MKTMLLTILMLVLTVTLTAQVIKSAVSAKAGINSYSCTTYNLPSNCLNK